MRISITRTAPRPTAAEFFEIGFEDGTIPAGMIRELGKLGVVERHGGALVSLITLYSELQIEAAIRRAAASS